MKTQLNRSRFAFIFVIILVFTAACQSQPIEATNSPVSPSVQPSATSEPQPTSPPAATPTEAPPPLPTETPLPDADQARAAIIQALLALSNQPNRMTVTTALQDGTTSTNIIESVPPDRKRIISPEADVEYVVIGETVYMKVGGAWATVQIPAVTFMGEPVNEQTLAATLSEPQFLRLDELDGMPVAVYGYQSTTLASGIELHSQVELWISLTDSRVYQMITDGETLSVSTDASGQSVSLAVPALSTTRIEYDPALTIEPPLP
jgi:hypothetical protein